MKLETILLGAAVVVVGYIALQALKPAPAPKPSSFGPAGLIDFLRNNDTANHFGSSLLSQASVALGGSSTW